MKPHLELIDGWKRAAEEPRTFHVPSPQDLMRLQPGMVVKLGVAFPSPVPNPAFPRWGGRTCGGERFWVRVKSTTPQLEGVVEQSDMLLAEHHGIRHGDTIFFQPNNILAIYE
jgi:hypothetical protein